MKLNLTIFSASLWLFIPFYSFTQTIEESDVPMRLVLKNYSLYPNASINEWKHYDEEDNSYEVNFIHEENELSVSYTNKCNRILEEKTLKVIPRSVYLFLDKAHSRYKIYKLIKVSSFKTGYIDIIYHKLLYNSNKEVQVQFFDESMKPINEPSIDEVAIR